MKTLKNKLIEKILTNPLIKLNKLTTILNNNVLEIYFNDLNINEHIKIIDNKNYYTIMYIVDKFNKTKMDIFKKMYFVSKEKEILVKKDLFLKVPIKYIKIVENDFIFDDIIEYLSVIVNKMFKEFKEANNNNNNRLTTKVSIIKRKQFEIDELNKEIESLKPYIEEKMLNTVYKTWKKDDVIILKDNINSINLIKNKKYYINNFFIKYEKDQTPSVKVEVGRLKNDDSFNRNIIGSDNIFNFNSLSIFDKSVSNKKEKFATVNTFIYGYKSTIFYKKDYEIINNKIIRYTKNGKYGTNYSSNFISSIKRTLEKLNLKLVNFNNVVEYEYKNNTYLYFCLNKKSPTFTATKKSIEDLIKLIKENSPFLIKMPKEYSKNTFLEEGSKNYSDFLTKEIIKQVKLLSN